jgi:hypothetical protein
MRQTPTNLQTIKKTIFLETWNFLGQTKDEVLASYWISTCPTISLLYTQSKHPEKKLLSRVKSIEKASQFKVNKNPFLRKAIAKRWVQLDQHSEQVPLY